MTRMTRAHFKLIATSLRLSAANDLTVKTMAETLAATNPRFDRQKFITAATYAEPVPTPAPTGEKAKVLEGFKASPAHRKYVALYSRAA